jgi:hypothetical protein
MGCLEQGYDAFAEVVEVTRQRYRVQLVSEEGTPRVPELEAIVEFLIGMSTGEVEKGGSRAARSKDWYASALWEKSQAEMFMREEQKGKYGWGAHKDSPYRLARIEQYVTGLRQWLTEQLSSTRCTTAGSTRRWRTCGRRLGAGGSRRTCRRG